MIEREIVVDYEGRKFRIKFPNVGQLIDIESLKNGLTSGKYGQFAASGIKSMYLILDIVDTVAFLTVMCPKLRDYITDGDEDMDYMRMPPETAKKLVKTYKEQILPWYNRILTQLADVTNAEEEDDDKGNGTKA